MHGRPRLTRRDPVTVTRPLRRPGGPAAPAAAVAAVGALVLAGCSGQSLPAPARAGSPACVAATAKLPGSLLGKARGTTSTAGTAVYGDPRIVVRCGIPPLGPTQLRCLSIDDVDWVVDDGGDPLVFTTFGRDPAVEVRIPASYPRENDSGALVDLRPVALALPKTSLHCIG